MRSRCTVFLTAGVLLWLALGCLEVPDLSRSNWYQCSSHDDCISGFRCEPSPDGRHRCVHASLVDTHVEADVPQQDVAADQDAPVEDTDAGGDTRDTTLPDTDLDIADVADVPQKKADGEPCTAAAECESGKCAEAPASAYRQCTPAWADCADGLKRGLLEGQSLCDESRSYTCQSDGTFEEEDCDQTVSCGYYEVVARCVGGKCVDCPTACDTDHDCTTEGYCCTSEGYCEKPNECVARLVEGTLCVRNAMCASGSCAMAPDGNSYCGKQLYPCWDHEGGQPVSENGQVCFDGDSYTCKSGGFFREDCSQACGYFKDVDSCSDEQCLSCAESCQSDTDCDASATCNEAHKCVPRAEGNTCTDDGDCDTGFICAWAPDGSKFCITGGARCSDGRGGFVSETVKVCWGDDLYECKKDGDFYEGSFSFHSNCFADCDWFADVDACVAETKACKDCPATCVIDADCDPGGHCQTLAGACVEDLTNGEPCDRGEMCISDTCRQAPDNAKQCVPANAECADGAGNALRPSETVCHNKARYLCTGQNSFSKPHDCADDCGFFAAVNECKDGDCTPCKTVCVSGQCDEGAYCDISGSCLEKKADGDSCRTDSVCQSDNCRLDVDGAPYCTPADKLCSDGQGGGYAMGEGTCQDNVAYRCIAEDTFYEIDCDDQTCTDGECK